MPQRPSDPFPLRGGLNLVTPAAQIAPGNAIAAVNYEPVEKGYQRHDGFERFDGQPKPSEASYSVLNFDQGTAAVSEGNTVTGLTSGATGKALIDGVVSSGSYVGTDAAGYLVLTTISGTFQDNEDLQVSAATKCVADGLATGRGASTDANDTTWHQDAIETARALIGTITGSGIIRGAWVYKGDTYAIRDNAGATAGVMFKATTAGWVAQTFGTEIDFTSGGTYEIAEGDTVTGATSTETAIVERVIVQSGSWSGGDAAGYLVLSSQSGVFQAENLDVGANLDVATIAGDSTTITLPAGGRYEFINHNFYGASDLERMYGVNGVGNAIEWDGSVLTLIRTGMTTDTPNHISEFKNHLVLAFSGGSSQNSGTGAPLSWSVLTGAAEISIGSDITGYGGDVAGGLIIFGRNRIRMLIGNDTDDFSLDPVTREGGGIEWSIQQAGNVIYHDDAGLRDLRTAQYFADWKFGTLTSQIEPLIKANKKAGISPIASLVCKAKGQYRLYWDDGTGISMYLGLKSPEILPFDLDKIVYCTCSGEDSNGNEIMFFGSDDGYLYQIDSGTSYDGVSVDAYVRLPFNHLGSPSKNKRYNKAAAEIDGPATMTLSLVAEFDNSSGSQPPSAEQSFSIQGGGGFWDQALYNDFYWSAAIVGEAEAYIDGFGKNISVSFVSNVTYEEPHTLNSLIIHSSPRGYSR